MVDSRLFVAKSLTPSTSAEFERGQAAHLLPILFRHFSRSGEPRILGHLGKEGRSVWNTKPLHNSLDRPIVGFFELHAAFNSLIERRDDTPSYVMRLPFCASLVTLTVTMIFGRKLVQLVSGNASARHAARF